MPSSKIFYGVEIESFFSILILNPYPENHEQLCHVAFEYCCGHWGAFRVKKRLRTTAQGPCHHNPVKIFASMIQRINDYDY